MAITKISPSVVDFNDGITITVDDNSNNLTLTSTDADANSGPNLDLYRNSSSPAASDVLGTIFFHGEDGAGNKEEYVRIQSVVDAKGSGAEVGVFQIFTNNAGTLTNNRFEIDGTGVTINESGGNFDFRAESASNTNALFLDAGENAVGLQTNTEADGTAMTSPLTISASNHGGNGFEIHRTGNSIFRQYMSATGTSYLDVYGSSSPNHSFFVAGSAVAKVTANGICFGSDTAAANALDDYEVGSFSIGIDGGTLAAGNTTAYYVKIGQMVWFYWYSGGATINSVSGAAKLVNLPFTANSTGYTLFQYVHGNAVDGNSKGGYINVSTTQASWIDDGAVAQSSFNGGSSQYIMVQGMITTDS